MTRAEKAHRAALHVYKPDVDPDGRAQSLVNLASVAIRQIPYGPPSVADRAVRYCYQALKLCDDDTPIDVKLTAMLNLSTALSERDTKEPIRNIQAALKVLDQAHLLASKSNHPRTPELHLNKAVILIDLCQNYSADRIEEAADILKELSGSFDPSETPDHWVLYQRCRTIVACMIDESKDMWVIATNVFEHAHSLIETTESLDEKIRLISDMAEICDLGVIGAMLEAGPDAAIEFGLRSYGLLFDQEQHLEISPKTGDVHLYFFNPQLDDWALVIARYPKRKELIRLPKLAHSFWSASLNDGPESFLQAREKLEIDGTSTLFKSFLTKWIAELSDGTAMLAESLKDNNIKRIVLHAFGKWSLAPFAALEACNGEQTWSDKFALSFGSTSKNRQSIGSAVLVHVMDKGLPQAEAEGAALAERFQTTETLWTLPEVQDALEHHEKLDVLHFTCHGHHDVEYIDEGGIRCPDQNILTARWIYENAMLKDCSLVVIAACESGVSDYNRLPNEGFGLPRSFLKAGAKAVISTLWPVDDLATRILIERFYDELASGTDIAKALSHSQRYLRELSIGQLHNHLRWQTSLRLVDQQDDERDADPHPFAHPFYWAGYILHQG